MLLFRTIPEKPLSGMVLINYSDLYRLSYFNSDRTKPDIYHLFSEDLFVFHNPSVFDVPLICFLAVQPEYPHLLHK